MAATPSSLAMRRTAIRERIYTLLLSQPRKVWTVRQVTDALASGGRVSDDMVRPVLYVLLADHIMAAVSGSRALTLTLSADGVAALRAIMTNWPAQAITPGKGETRRRTRPPQYRPRLR
jgi:hypothetical protein